MTPRRHLFMSGIWHPVYRQQVTIDAAAVDRDAAVRSMLRFVDRENRRLRRRRLPRAALRPIRRPQRHTIRFVPAAQLRSEQAS